jgi:hypothetical protein
VATGASVPHTLPVQIGTRQYLVDAERVQRRTLPSQRQAFTQNPAGLDAVNLEGAWTKVVGSWHHGGGQYIYDAEFSDPYRCNYPIGAYIGTPGSVSIDLSDTATSIDANIDGSNCNAAATYSYYYARSGTTLKRWSVDLSANVTVTGITSPICLTAYGGYIYATDGSSIFRGIDPAASVSSWSTQDATLIAACNGRFLATNSTTVYEIDSGGTPSTVWTNPDSGGAWSALVGAPGAVYGAFTGSTGDGTIYVWTDVDNDGTLAAPYVALVLPRRETVNVIEIVAGDVIALGTTAGVRICPVNGDGTLTLGPLNIGKSELNGSIVGSMTQVSGLAVFGDILYVSAADGLFKLYLGQFVADWVPAWVHINSIPGSNGTLAGGSQVFCVNTGLSVALFPHLDRPDLYPLSHGTQAVIATGLVTFGVNEPKMPLSVEASHDPLPANTSVKVEVFSATYSSLGSTTNSTAGTVVTSLTLAATVALQRSFDVLITLASSDATKTPKVRALKIRAAPVLPRQEEVIFSLNLRSTVKVRDGSPATQSPIVEYDYLNGLISTGAPVQITEGSKSYYALVDQLVKSGDEDGAKWSDDDAWYEGEFLVRLITLALT